MRALSIAAGIIGFTAIAASAGDGVIIKAPTRTWEAEYVYDPGSADMSNQSVSVTRQFKFYMADATIDPAHPQQIAPVADDNIREYRYSDVQDAIAQAQAEANAKHKKVQDLLPKYLAQLPLKTVDCRQVARTMIETLVGYRIKDTKLDDGSMSLQYVKDQDQMDVAMTAKQLDSITISRDPSITEKDQDPRFTCRSTVVNGSPAQCGDLRLRFNPLEATSGVFKGQKAVIFDKDACAPFSEKGTMDEHSCELLVQVQRCGLRYTEKAEGKRVKDPSTQGLADYLEFARDRELRNHESGTAVDRVATDTTNNGGPSRNSVDDGFKLPSDPGSKLPLE